MRNEIRFVLKIMRIQSTLVALLVALLLCSAGTWAQEPSHGEPSGAHGAAPHAGTAAAGNEAGAGHGEKIEAPGTFDPHAGTWINPITRAIFGLGPVEKHVENAGKSNEKVHYSNIKYDYIVLAVMVLLGLALVGTMAGKQARVRPDGKPTSLANMVETALEGFQNYLIGVMGERLALKYTPLIATFFFTILCCNWMGLIPGLLAPTSNPNVPIGMAIVAFFSVHIIAIREAGFKSWIMHFVGEPIWLAWLNFPLHIIGEFIKPISLSLRLMCNVFGEEVMVTQIAIMAIGIATALHLPSIIPLQLPFMLLGVFFGALQALVFSTLLAIYISILSTHHGDHDGHNDHGHVEHVTAQGHHQAIGHPSEMTVA